MIQLQTSKYHKLVEPLKSVKFNKFFALAIIEKHIRGEVFVDNVHSPQSFYVIHPYGMSLLFGNWKNIEFNAALFDYAIHMNQPRHNYIWIQAYPNEWNGVLKKLFQSVLIKPEENKRKKGPITVELQTRVNFKFNFEKYKVIRADGIKQGLDIVSSNKEIFKEMKGSVVPSSFWDSSKEFLNRGVGFSLFHANKLVTTAFSAFVHDNSLELGMETFEEYRGKGFAKQACFALIDYCIENNYEPIWSCSYENMGSYNLALKLGFEPSLKIPYYRLSKSMG